MSGKSDITLNNYYMSTTTSQEKNQTIKIWVNHLNHSMCNSNELYEITEHSEPVTSEQRQYIEFSLAKSADAYKFSSEAGRYEEFKFFGKSWEFFVNSSAYNEFLEFQKNN